LPARGHRAKVSAVGENPKTSASHPLHVDFLPDHAVNLDGRIGMCEAPGRKDPTARDGPWRRDLDADLDRLVRRYGANILVTLLERGQYVSDELTALGISDLLVRTQRRKIQSEWSAMPDGNVPVSLDQLYGLVERILTEVRADKVVVIHCRDGLGRTGLVAASCLIALGASVAEALATVRDVRPGAVETAAQHQILRSFDGLWRKRARAQSIPDDISDPFDARDSAARRFSQPGTVPLSRPGAATITYLGLDAAAAEAGVGEGAPLRPGDVFHIMPGTVMWLGRAQLCQVRVASQQLSGIHALLAFVPAAEERLVLADLGSRNGTWIGDQQVAAAELEVGDRFSLARAFVFRFESIG
jgi:hypothetical protein